jgi:hypothetical protein
MTEEKNTTPLHGSNIAREQIPAACKWHVSDIYASEKDWHAKNIKASCRSCRLCRAN